MGNHRLSLSNHFSSSACFQQRPVRREKNAKLLGPVLGVQSSVGRGHNGEEVSKTKFLGSHRSALIWPLKCRNPPGVPRIFCLFAPKSHRFNSLMFSNCLRHVPASSRGLPAESFMAIKLDKFMPQIWGKSWKN